MGITNIEIRPVRHTMDEMVMRHKMWFDYKGGCDGISATANMDGFTVLNAIKMRFQWDGDMLCKAANECNKRDEIAVLDFLSPKLFLVPRTRIDDAEKSTFYMRDLLNAVDRVETKRLQFTHYSFLDNLGFKKELGSVVSEIYDETLVTNLLQLIFDVDYRVSAELDEFVMKVRIG